MSSLQYPELSLPPPMTSDGSMISGDGGVVGGRGRRNSWSEHVHATERLRQQQPNRVLYEQQDSGAQPSGSSSSKRRLTEQDFEMALVVAVVAFGIIVVRKPTFLKNSKGSVLSRKTFTLTLFTSLLSVTPSLIRSFCVK